MKSPIITSQNATVTIQVYGETGETITIDDGMGGEEEIPEEDWHDVIARQPARFMPDGLSLEREDRGDRVSDAPAVGVHPRSLGTLTDGEFEFVEKALGQPGVDKRVDINAAGAPPGRTKVTKVWPEYGMGRTPIAIWFELATVTESSTE